MKEKILKLLNSNDLDNAILAINLAYHLSEEEFASLFFNLKLAVDIKYPGSMYFKRNHKTYYFGHRIIYYYEHHYGNVFHPAAYHKDLTP